MCGEASFHAALQAGVWGFRLAMGLHDRDHAADFRAIRAVAAHAALSAGVIVDLPAARPRTGSMPSCVLTQGEQVQFVDAQAYEPDQLGVPLPGLSRYLDWIRPGHRLIFRDGRQVFRILAAGNVGVTAECLFASEPLEASNGCMFPDCPVVYDPVRDADRDALAAWAEEGLKPEWICASLVSNVGQIKQVREIANTLWPEDPPRVMAKIETAIAVDIADTLAVAADGLLLGRGDLGLSVPMERLPMIQDRLARLARCKGKPLAVATQILERFAETGTAYRAELSDIALAARQNMSFLVLCQETSNSSRPLACIDLARRIIEVESENL